MKSLKGAGLVVGAVMLFIFVADFFGEWQILSSQGSAQTETPHTPRNIVYIMLDDAGYYDVGFTNPDRVLADGTSITPHLDALRDGGKMFTQFYSASSICSPTRASVLTGNNPVQHGVFDAWPQADEVDQADPGMSGLPRSIPQMGKVMKAQGLTTAHHGKWHVGMSRSRYRHKQLGFDDFSYHQRLSKSELPDLYKSPGKYGPFEFVTPEDGSQIFEVDYLDTYFADQIIDFIDTHGDERMYINYWPLTPHAFFTPPRGFDYSVFGDQYAGLIEGEGSEREKSDEEEAQNPRQTTDRVRIDAMMHALDKEVGRIVAALDTQGVLEETLIVFTSDNGQMTKHMLGDFRAGKHTLFEGGIRMPTIMHWPHGIEAGTESDTVMTTYDLLPTFLDLLGGDPTDLYDEIDGRSKKQAIIDDVTLTHEPILWELNGSPVRKEDERANRTYAYREGDYKIVKPARKNDATDDRAYKLYNLAVDPLEKRDLVFEEPEILEDMKSKLLQKRRDVSRYHAIPEEVGARTVIPFDPRLDVGSKDMTFMMDVIVPDDVPSAKNIYYKPGSQRMTLIKGGALQWRIVGSDKSANTIHKVLKSEQLTPGRHTIVMRIAGFKKDYSRAELYIDGELVDSIDKEDYKSEHKNIWSTVSDAALGDDDLVLENIRYYQSLFWLDELS